MKYIIFSYFELYFLAKLFRWKMCICIYVIICFALQQRMLFIRPIVCLAEIICAEIFSGHRYAANDIIDMMNCHKGTGILS